MVLPLLLQLLLFVATYIWLDRSGQLLEPWKVKSIIKCGFVATMVLSILIAALLAINPLNRWQALFKNARLLGAGHQSPRPLGGQDELQFVDNLLFAMSKDLEAALERERQFACTDEFSGLANRLSLDGQAERLYALARRYSRPLSFMLIGIDNYGSIVDMHGQAAGVEVIRLVVGAIRSAIRSSDFAARWDRGQFAVLLPETDLQSCLILAERLRALIESSSVTLPGGVAVAVTASFGCTEPYEADTKADDVLARAEKSLSSSLRNGQNQVQAAPPELPGPPARALQWNRQAAEHGQSQDANS